MNNLDMSEKNNCTYFVSESLLEKLNKSEKVDVYGHEVSIKFLKLILQDETCFSYAKRYFKDEIRNFRISTLKDGNIIGNLFHPKGLIVKGIDILIQNNDLKLSSEEEKRFNELKEIISFNKFLDLNKNKIYDIEIENVKYSILVKDIIDFFALSDSEYDKICFDDNIKEIYGIPKKHFAYASYMYFLQNYILTRYDAPKKMCERYNEIRHGKKIDIYAINKILSTTDIKHKEAKISSELYKAILDGMPSTFNPLEKAIYIYIKMCKILTYDSEYFASNNVGYSTLKHLDSSYAFNITPENNEAVCFEFNLIYSKLLSELKINFETYYGNGVYGRGHANLKFRYGDYIVFSDAILNTIKSDLTYAKLNQPLRGLKCENVSSDTVDKFNKIFNKVYEIIIKQENKKESPYIHVHTYDELISEYQKHTKNIKSIDLIEKISILLSKLNSLGLKQIDYFSYALQLRKILFNEDERSNNISAVIVAKKIGPSYALKKVPYMIVTVNEDGFLINSDKNKYYYLEDNGVLMPVTSEELKEDFDSEKLKYISDISVPGFDNKGVSK